MLGARDRAVALALTRIADVDEERAVLGDLGLGVLEAEVVDALTGGGDEVVDRGPGHARTLRQVGQATRTGSRRQQNSTLARTPEVRANG